VSVYFLCNSTDVKFEACLLVVVVVVVGALMVFIFIFIVIYLPQLRRYMYFTEDFRLIPSARCVDLKP
jgi:hypothetical protein